MKKVLVLLLSLVLIVGCLAVFSACTDKDNYDLVVGAIYIGGQDEATGYTAAHANGIKQAIANLEALDYKVDLQVVDKVDDQDFDAVAAACDTLVAKNCDIIFGISFGYLWAMDEKAKEYPEVAFSHGTGFLSNDTNYNNYFGRIYQARYLSGIAAGLKSLEMEESATVDPNSIGYVAAYTYEYAETTSGINAFALGVQSVNPEAVLHVKSIETWGDPIKEKEAAEFLINTNKCAVIAQHCDSAQPQIVAADNDIFGCGYNTDMTADAPTAHLTAPIWNWDVYYQKAMQAAIDKPAAEYVDTVGGNYLGGLAEGFVDISPLSENCAPDTAKYIELARDQMVNKGWDVFQGRKLVFNKEGSEISVAVVNAALGRLVIASADNGLEEDIICEANGITDDGVITGTMNAYVAGIEGDTIKPTEE